MKLEWENPTGSLEDRMAMTVISGASSRGVATVLKRYKPSIRVVVESGESSVLQGGEAGPHKIEGVGIGYTPLWEPSLVNEILPVGTDEAKEMARRIAREEGLFAGTSSGANVVEAAQFRLVSRPKSSASIFAISRRRGIRWRE
ncbi:MAG: pyridoxal-phosphate dependent enzyme [Gemmatimonadaceae bacterium]